jgi:hypothetical protein
MIWKGRMTSSRTICRLALPLVLGLTLLAPAVARATPREDLLQLVPDNVAMCYLVEDLRDHTDKLAAAPWIKRLQQSAMVKTMLASPDLNKLLQFDAEVQKHLGISSRQLRDGILGDCMIFALQRGPVINRTQEEFILVMVWARDPDLLSRVIQRVNEAQQQSGEIRGVDDRRYKGISYKRRQETKRDQFYYQNGSLFVFSSHEPLLQQVLDRSLSPRRPASRVQQSFQRLKHDGALLTFWLNPRAFDAELRQKAEQEESDLAQVQRNFLRYWQAVDAAAISLVVQPDPELLVSVQGRPQLLPEAAKKFLRTAGEPSELLGRFPRNAAYTLTCRLDFGAALATIEDVLPPKSRKELHDSLQKTFGAPLGMNFTREVLPYLGPDMGLYVAPAPPRPAGPRAVFILFLQPGLGAPPGMSFAREMLPHLGPAANPILDSSSFPHMLLALRVQRGPQEAPVDEALWNALNFYAGAMVLGHNLKNKDQLRLKTMRQGDVEVKYLENRQFPPGLQPAFALKDGYLLLASNPEVIQRFDKAGPLPARPTLLHVSYGEVSRLLRQNRALVVQAMCQKNQLTKTMANEILDDVLSSLALFDHMELSQRTIEGQVTWSLRLRTSRAEK